MSEMTMPKLGVNPTEEEDLFEDLKALGVRYEDGTKEGSLSHGQKPCQLSQEEPGCERVEHRECGKTSSVTATGRATFPKGEGLQAVQGEKSVSLRERLLGCIKWSGICGGIGMLLWWFQINDLMAVEAAFPCICVCGTLAGFGVGKHAMR